MDVGCGEAALLGSARRMGRGVMAQHHGVVVSWCFEARRAWTRRWREAQSTRQLVDTASAARGLFWIGTACHGSCRGRRGNGHSRYVLLREFEAMDPSHRIGLETPSAFRGVRRRCCGVPLSSVLYARVASLLMGSATLDLTWRDRTAGMTVRQPRRKLDGGKWCWPRFMVRALEGRGALVWQ